MHKGIKCGCCLGGGALFEACPAMLTVCMVWKLHTFGEGAMVVGRRVCDVPSGGGRVLDVL